MLRNVEVRGSTGFGGDHCLAPSRSVDAPVDGGAGRYERLFAELPALAGEGVGGRIVAEVLLGILDADPGSYRANDPGWTPTLPSREGRFGLTDLLSPTEEERR